jgi:hypothetical protein
MLPENRAAKARRIEEHKHQIGVKTTSGRHHHLRPLATPQPHDNRLLDSASKKGTTPKTSSLLDLKDQGFHPKPADKVIQPSTTPPRRKMTHKSVAIAGTDQRRARLSSGYTDHYPKVEAATHGDWRMRST